VRYDEPTVRLPKALIGKDLIYNLMTLPRCMAFRLHKNHAFAGSFKLGNWLYALLTLESLGDHATQVRVHVHWSARTKEFSKDISMHVDTERLLS
jgi:hypothetical protein